MSSGPNDRGDAAPPAGKAAGVQTGGVPVASGGRARRVVLVLLGMVAVIGLVWAGDLVTGRHLHGVVERCADRLAVWYDSRRLPGYPCAPDNLVPYTGMPEIAIDVPQCWKPEVRGLLDRVQHSFNDPEARVGTVTISVEPIDAPEAREALLSEFKTLSARPGAIVGESLDADTGDSAETAPEEPATTPPDSLAGRLDEESRAEGDVTSKPEVAPAVSAGLDKLSPYWTLRIRTRGQVGSTTSGRGKDGIVPDSAYPRSVWSWLLIGDRMAVRVVYSVREEWRDDSIVLDEFDTVRSIVASIKPAK